MNFFKLLSRSKLALTKESEFDLNYFLSGNKIKQVMDEDKRRPKPILKGFFFQSLLFFFRLLRNLSFFEKRLSHKPIYVVLGSFNQFNSVKSTLESLDANGDEFFITASKNVIPKNLFFKDTISLKYNFKIIFCSLILFFSRVIPLYFKLKREKRDYEIAMHFNLFCEAYILVPYFIDILEKTKPKIIIVSNDHHVFFRSVRISAEISDIKTLYVQHAQVSKVFPPLEFDYALLDGNVAYETYLNAYQIQKKTNTRIKKNSSNCQVLLTGQKKIVIKKNKRKKLEGLHIGLAVNPMDDFYDVNKILDHFSNMKVKCIVRTHQSQPLFFIRKLKAYIEDKSWLRWSNSSEELVEDYFMNVNLLIASNSSIHLEAALAGVPTLYYEMSSEVLFSDYYGYVEKGISKRLENDFTYEKIKNSIKNQSIDIKKQYAIKNYSETYGTKWQNLEGDLSALIINRILNNKSLDDLFKTQKSKIYNSVYFLK